MHDDSYVLSLMCPCAMTDTNISGKQEHFIFFCPSGKRNKCKSKTRFFLDFAAIYTEILRRYWNKQRKRENIPLKL